mmetsp:Transcript_23976/g.47858  ORF Transcript_23976/g.47858 Transcript_23976/m.47858 type:complete len:343 (+) Transcript_23976:190-1218(+)
MISSCRKTGLCLAFFVVLCISSLSHHPVHAQVSISAKDQNTISSPSKIVEEAVGDPGRKLRSIGAVEGLIQKNKNDRHLQEEELTLDPSTVEDAASPTATDSPDDTDPPKRLTQQQVPTTPSSYRAAWIAHGALAAIAWGLFVPFAIGSAWFRDLIPTYWIYIHVFVNVFTFALTFFAVIIAFATMKSMGEAGEGHLKERHHVVGLALLLLVTVQTANGFLRPPREYVNEDDDTNTEMADSVVGGRKSATPRNIWYLCHSLNGLVLFCLGTWQVMSGLNIFSLRFATANWSSVYFGYILWVVVVFVGVKFWLKYKERQGKLQAWRHGGVHDPENDMAPVQYE